MTTPRPPRCRGTPPSSARISRTSWARRRSPGSRRSDDPAVGAVIDLTEPDRGEDKAGEADDADDADDATKKDAKGRLEVGGVRSSTG